MISILIIALGLAMDSFSASLVLGGNVQRSRFVTTSLTTSAIFGFFHILMISLGFLIGEASQSFVSEIDHWIAFALLLIIGARMIAGSFHSGKKRIPQKNLDVASVLTIAFATSIDALILGMGIAFIGLSIPIVVMAIGIVVFILSLTGFQFGLRGKSMFQDKATIAGGIILILMGMKILFEHLAF